MKYVLTIKPAKKDHYLKVKSLAKKCLYIMDNDYIAGKKGHIIIIMERNYVEDKIKKDLK